MTLSEDLLFAAARRLYATEVAHSNEMKAAVRDPDAYDRWRRAESAKMLGQLEHQGISLTGKVAVDFGCNDGAMSASYLEAGAAQVIGLDIDVKALARARALHAREGLDFRQNGLGTIPVESGTVDVIVTFDVMEHVAKPLPILREMHRILKPGGQVVIGTIGWKMPFSPHLWSVMPVPWAHVLWSEKSLLKVCRRVYHSAWYQPNMHDLDASGQRKPDKFVGMEISREYLNHYGVADFERDFKEAGFRYRTDIVTLQSRWLRWLKPLRHVPWVREFIGGSVWFVLTKA